MRCWTRRLPQYSPRRGSDTSLGNLPSTTGSTQVTELSVGTAILRVRTAATPPERPARPSKPVGRARTAGKPGRDQRGPGAGAVVGEPPRRRSGLGDDDVAGRATTTSRAGRPGQPPRWRSGRAVAQVGQPVVRSTSALAERTARPWTRPRTASVNLRVGGADAARSASVVCWGGQPPRWRSGRRLDVHARGRLRSTSALAERTAAAG